MSQRLDGLSSGWDKKLFVLLLLSLTELSWGIALAIFASGKVPITWVVSEWAKQNPAILSVTITALGTLSTTFIKYVFKQMIIVHARAKLTQKFTLPQWKLMQGLKEWDVNTPFPWKLRPLWVVIWVATAAHSASIVAILRPVEWVANVHFNDLVPCAVNRSSLIFGDDPNLSQVQQTGFNITAFDIGRQWRSYYDAIAANITTAVPGRVYVKENVTYAAVGGLAYGLQEVPGVVFNASCSQGTSKNSPDNSWSRVFPGRSLPTISVVNNSLVSIVDDQNSSSSSERAVSSASNVDAKTPQTAFYGLVSIDGTGGIISADAEENIVICTWLATPVVVQVQTIKFVAKAIVTEKSSSYPPFFSQGVLRTVEGIADAVAVGYPLDRFRGWNKPANVSEMEAVLKVVIADGTKGFLTGLVKATIQGWKYKHLGESMDSEGCSSNNRTVAVHWKFGNERGVGYIAIIMAISAGIYGCSLAWRLSRQRWLKGMETLAIDVAFTLGTHSSDLEGVTDEPLQVRYGRAIRVGGYHNLTKADTY